MITLITGAPGSGKTLSTLKMVTEEWGGSGRPVFYCGIKDCILDGWSEISYDEAKNWRDYEANTIFVIDEADLWAPNTPEARKTVPSYIKELARHRHRGVDFYVITQKPTLVHFDLRPHIGRHFHYERQFNRNSSRRMEWQRCVDDPIKDWAARKEADVQRKRFPKEYYSMYKSAEVHTMKPKVPKKVFMVFGLLGLAAFVLFHLINKIDDRKNAIPVAQNSSPLGEVISDIGPWNRDAITPDMRIADAENYTTDLLPRVQDIPWSAPIYDGLTEVKTFPRPQCMLTVKSGDCRCYTQQATPMAVSYDMCREIVANGWFNPFRDEEAELAKQNAALARSQALAAAQRVTNQREGNQRVTFVPDTVTSRERLIDASELPFSNQPGRAYRNPASTVPVAPRAP